MRACSKKQIIFPGVTLCRKKRAEAQEENARRRKTDSDRILSFLNSRDRIEREKKRNMENKTMTDDQMERDDMFTDEYGEKRHGEDSLPDYTERENYEGMVCHSIFTQTWYAVY